MKLSVVLATRNEEKNIGRCLTAVAGWADEIIIFDERSTDRTVAIARKYKAKVFLTDHEPLFHITKQKAIDKAKGEWILQLDADEVVTEELRKEIDKVIRLSEEKRGEYQEEVYKNNRLFGRHQKLLQARDGRVGKAVGHYAAFFVPRSNLFLGRYLQHGGVYPDGVIRFVRRGKAHFPCKSVHEQIVVEGRVGWLESSLQHLAYPSFYSYIERFNRYTDLEAKSVTGGFFANLFWKPLFDRDQGVLFLYFRHLGFLDGFPGFIWALFSALHFPIAYFKSLELKRGRSESFKAEEKRLGQDSKS